MGIDGEYEPSKIGFGRPSPEATIEIREGYGDISTVNSLGEFVPGGCPERRKPVRGVVNNLFDYKRGDADNLDPPPTEAA